MFYVHRLAYNAQQCQMTMGNLQAHHVSSPAYPYLILSYLIGSEVLILISKTKPSGAVGRFWFSPSSLSLRCPSDNNLAGFLLCNRGQLFQ